jgi:transcriptional regulator with XRE-family HTH domain
MADTFQNRLQEALNQRGMKQVDLANATGYSKARISQWIHGKYLPTGEALTTIARKLNVSESWLIGNDVKMDLSDREEFERKCNPYDLLTKQYGSESYELVELFSKLNATGKQVAIDTLKAWSTMPQYTTAAEKGDKGKMA